jgi:tetratricopeptide (TPR) repeat protein
VQQPRDPIDRLAAAVLADPSNPGAYLELGRALSAQHMVQEAIAALEAAFVLSPRIAWHELALAYEQDRRFDKALEVWRTRLDYLVQLEPGAGRLDNPQADYATRSKARSRVDSLRGRVDRFHRAGKFQQALAECKLAVASWSIAYEVSGERSSGRS